MNNKIKCFALLTVCLFFVAIFTSACGGGGKNPPPTDNSAYYYLLAQQNANNNQQPAPQEENNNQQEENNPVEEEVTEVTLDDDVLQKLGYQKVFYQTEDGDYYIIKKIDTTKNITLEENEVTSVEIPSTFTYENKTYKITKIGNKAFWCCEHITSVTIPDTVTEIEDGGADETEPDPYGAFLYSGITSIELPNSVTKIGDFAFCLCKQLTTINIPENVTTIGMFAFYGCGNENLSITIPDSVKTIGGSAFERVQNISYTDRDELRNQEQEVEGDTFGYPHWGAYYYNGEVGYNPRQ